MQTVTLSLFRFETAAARLWAFAQMGLARPVFARLPGIGFHKLLGSGVGEGFTPIPNTRVYGALAVWADLATAQERIATAPFYRRYRRRAAEHLSLFLRPTASRGRWSGFAPFHPLPSTREGPGSVAALTRATINPMKLREFWSHEPEISARIGADPNVRLKIGMGELPWVTQATFSIWPDAASIAAFARADGPHARAIQAVRAGGFFTEELYARFEVLKTWGCWEGRDPLERLEAAPGEVCHHKEAAE